MSPALPKLSSSTVAICSVCVRSGLETALSVSKCLKTTSPGRLRVWCTDQEPGQHRGILRDAVSGPPWPSQDPRGALLSLSPPYKVLCDLAFPPRSAPATRGWGPPPGLTCSVHFSALHRLLPEMRFLSPLVKSVPFNYPSGFSSPLVPSTPVSLPFPHPCSTFVTG